MPDQLDEDFWRSQPTWDLICELMGVRHHETIKAVLRERIQALGAPDLLELVALEAVYHETGLPQTVAWDPAIVGSGVTLPDYEDEEENGFEPSIRPLRLRWNEQTQIWMATTVMEAGPYTFGHYPTVAEADAAYRTLVGLPAERASEVFVDDEAHCRTIVNGEIVPALAAPGQGASPLPGPDLRLQLTYTWDEEKQKLAVHAKVSGEEKFIGYFTHAECEARNFMHLMYGEE